MRTLYTIKMACIEKIEDTPGEWYHIHEWWAGVPP